MCHKSMTHPLFRFFIAFIRPMNKTNSANCHNEKAPTVTTDLGQLPQQIWVNCHNKIGK